MLSRFQTRSLAAAMVGLALVFCAGCAPGVPSGTVTGKVTIKGQPAKPGTMVTFLMDSGTTATGQVTEGGSYKLRNNGAANPESIPTGTYKVSVAAPGEGAAQTEEDYEKMMAGGAKPPEAKKDKSIPPKYNNPQTSGLKFEIKTGANTFDIAIE